MKTRLINSLLVVLLVLPAFAPWIPHEAVHALHDQHQSHHANNASADGTESHKRAALGHKEQTLGIVHHPVSLDAVTYFQDYLHTDLQRRVRVVLKAPAREFQDADLELASGLLQPQRHQLASVIKRAPPDWRSSRPSHTPLYLSTQRLRI